MGVWTKRFPIFFRDGGDESPDVFALSLNSLTVIYCKIVVDYVKSFSI